MHFEDVYEKYFSTNKQVIDDLISVLVSQGKQIAIWGAGQRGNAFLKVYDSQFEKIRCVYDKNEQRYGTVLETGHSIVDYRSDVADVVFIMNNAHEMSTKELLVENNSRALVINIDNIILGNLTVDDVLKVQKFDLAPVRNIKVAAIVILYNPEDVVYDNIMTYASKVDYLYIYDNSSIPNDMIKRNAEDLKNVIYIEDSSNAGLPKAINIVAREAIKKGIKWLITFDQDSQAGKSMIERMIAFANSSICDDRVGIIAPNITREDDIIFERHYTYFDKVFQSGAMHNLDILEKVGGYDEKLFIDQVDYEYCIRLRLSGYTIVKVNNAFLKHNLQDDEGVEEKFVNGKKMVINKYSKNRYYYICRNNLYLCEKYKECAPVYAKECYDNIVWLKNNAEIDVARQEHIEAIEKAYFDYENGVMGKVDWVKNQEV